MQMFVDVGSAKLFCEKAGAGRPIILLHGNGEDHTIFDVLAPQLAQNFTVYAVDSRGHGRSTPANFYDYRLMAGDIRRFIQVLGLQKPYLYGFSDGGVIGLILAAGCPGLLGRLMVSGANTSPQGLKPLTKAMIRGAWALTHDPKQDLMLSQPDLTAQELGAIDVPTLVLAGENDLVRPEHTKALAAAIPGAKLLVLPGQTHGSYVVHSPMLYPALQSFLLAE